MPEEFLINCIVQWVECSGRVRDDCRAKRDSRGSVTLSWSPYSRLALPEPSPSLLVTQALRDRGWPRGSVARAKGEVRRGEVSLPKASSIESTFVLGLEKIMLISAFPIRAAFELLTPSRVY